MTPGFYQIVKESTSNCVTLPVQKYWSCGDGCCSQWEPEELVFKPGEIIFVSIEQVGHETYTEGSEYEGYSTYYYRPNPYIDYVENEYLVWVGDTRPSI